MNPMEYFKKASEQRNKLNEEQTLSFVENSAPSNESLLPVLTKEQQKAMDDQNQLLLYIARKMGIKPYAVSRDKSGHALILEIKNLDGGNYPEVYCYALGLNTKTNKMMPYCVGKNTFKFTHSYGYILSGITCLKNDNLHINVLSTHPAFDGHGIGRVLLQATENIAVANNLKSMSLKQEICYVPNASKVSNLSKVELLSKNMDEYFKEFYFDKNMYFYYSNGFEEDYSQDYFIEVTDGLVPLKKDRLQKVALSYGLAKPLTKVDRNSPMFALKSTGYDTPTETAREYCYNNRFPTFLNDSSAEDFSPLTLKPNDSYTKYLYSFLATHRGKPVFTPTSEDKRTSARQIASGNFDTYGYRFNTVCSNPEYIQRIVENYEQLMEVQKHGQSERKVLPLEEMLERLYPAQAQFFKNQTSINKSKQDTNQQSKTDDNSEPKA